MQTHCLAGCGVPHPQTIRYLLQVAETGGDILYRRQDRRAEVYIPFDDHPACIAALLQDFNEFRKVNRSLHDDGEGICLYRLLKTLFSPAHFDVSSLSSTLG